MIDDAALGRGVRLVIRDRLAWAQAVDEAEAATKAAWRAKGFRLVTHDGDNDENGVKHWWYLDDETREVLAEGVGDEAFETAFRDDWANIDGILWDVYDGSNDSTEPDTGLPSSMIPMISEWVDESPVEALALLDS